MKKTKISIMHLAAVFTLLILVISCGKKDSQKDQKELIARIGNLEKRISELEKGAKKPENVPIVQKDEKKTETTKTATVQEEKKVQENKNRPTYFDFPEYKFEIRNFNYRVAVGGIIEYYGEVVNKGNKNINDLSLTTEFYDKFGNLIGGHSFPVKVIYANKERSFTNVDSLAGGFKNMRRYDIKVKYVLYDGGQLKEDAEEKWLE